MHRPRARTKRRGCGPVPHPAAILHVSGTTLYNPLFFLWGLRPHAPSASPPRLRPHAPSAPPPPSFRLPLPVIPAKAGIQPGHRRGAPLSPWPRARAEGEGERAQPATLLRGAAEPRCQARVCCAAPTPPRPHAPSASPPRPLGYAPTAPRLRPHGPSAPPPPSFRIPLPVIPAKAGIQPEHRRGAPLPPLPRARAEDEGGGWGERATARHSGTRRRKRRKRYRKWGAIPVTAVSTR